MELYGRKEIYTDVDEITAGNVVDVLREALVVHEQNRAEIEYLRKYSRGRQPILDRVKLVQQDINNKMVKNCAAMALNHKLSYIFAEPINYVQSAIEGESSSEGVTVLNYMLDEQRKDYMDQLVATDFLICGYGYHAVLANPVSTDESPFAIPHMLPETTFIIRKNDVFKRKIAGVSYTKKTDDTIIYTVYTDASVFELEGHVLGGLRLKETTKNGIGMIPIVRYTMPEEMGCFEKALPLCDAMNEIESDRQNGIQQFVNALLWLNNVNLDDDAIKKLKERFGLMTTSDPQVPVNVEYLTAELNQESSQSLVNDIYEAIQELCALPGSDVSTGGSTGAAAELSNGWRKAEDDAKRIETAFRAGEAETIKLICNILDLAKKTPSELKGLKPRNITVKFVRNKTANLLSKGQAMLNLRDAGVDPLTTLKTIDLFSDPEAVYHSSKQYMDKIWGALGEKKETVPANNQPRSDQSLQNSVTGKGTVQKRD